MVIKKTLVDILSTNKFFNRLIETSKLSRKDNESSFGVYGDLKRLSRLTHTKPLREEANVCRYGKDNMTGVVYNKKHYGLYVPENKSAIIDVHFHPIDSVAIPSEGDIGSTFSSYITNKAFPSKEFLAETDYIVPTSIVGLRKDSRIDLFVYQFRGGNIGQINGEFIDRYIRNKLGNEEGSLDFSDVKLPTNWVKEMNKLRSNKKRPQMNAEFFSFSNHSEYLMGMKRLRRFDFSGNIVDDCDNLDEEEIVQLEQNPSPLPCELEFEDDVRENVLV